MKLFFLYCLLFLVSAPAMAQDTYTPPPMFGAPAPVVQQPAAPAPTLTAPVTAPAVIYNDTAISPRPVARPRYSPATRSEEPAVAAVKPEEKYTGANNPLLPPIITKGDPALEKPKAPKKPKKAKATKAPVPVAKPAVTAPVKTAPAAPKVEAPAVAKIEAPVAPEVEKPAAPVMAKEAVPAKAMPAARVTSEGVVKGPKTMPSVPTTDVAAEKTFAEEKPSAQTMMERHQKQQAAKRPPAQAAAPDEKPIETAKAPAPETKAPVTAAPAISALTIPFEKGVTTTAADTASFTGLAQALSTNPASRLMIQAYANPTDEGANSSQRVSLARALSIRKTLLAQGVPSHRIDIRALGQKTDKSPTDRVDLTLYNGQNSAN